MLRHQLRKPIRNPSVDLFSVVSSAKRTSSAQMLRRPRAKLVQLYQPRTVTSHQFPRRHPRLRSPLSRSHWTLLQLLPQSTPLRPQPQLRSPQRKHQPHPRSLLPLLRSRRKVEALRLSSRNKKPSSSSQSLRSRRTREQKRSLRTQLLPQLSSPLLRHPPSPRSVQSTPSAVLV